MTSKLYPTTKRFPKGIREFFMAEIPSQNIAPNHSNRYTYSPVLRKKVHRGGYAQLQILAAIWTLKKGGKYATIKSIKKLTGKDSNNIYRLLDRYWKLGYISKHMTRERKATKHWDPTVKDYIKYRITSVGGCQFHYNILKLGKQRLKERMEQDKDEKAIAQMRFGKGD